MRYGVAISCGKIRRKLQDHAPNQNAKSQRFNNTKAAIKASRGLRVVRLRSHRRHRAPAYFANSLFAVEVTINELNNRAQAIWTGATNP
jgi:hypothetical protein